MGAKRKSEPLWDWDYTVFGTGICLSYNTGRE